MICLFLILIGFNYSGADEFKNTGYTYRRETDSYYNLHTEKRSWFTAREVCLSEDAELIVIQNEEEANVIAKMIEAAGFVVAHVGLQALLADGVFRTVEGVPMYAAYDTWNDGEPNNYGGSENCVEIYTTAKLNDRQCHNQILRPFVCRKRKQEYNKISCNKPYKDYYFNRSLGRCYKLHLKALDWKKAYDVCKSEESHLASIFNQRIADYFVEMVQPQIRGNNTINNVLLGFHDLFDSGYETVKGKKLDTLDYRKWTHSKPQQKCGAMISDNGLLNDVQCIDKAIFICEHDERIQRGSSPTRKHWKKNNLVYG